MSTLLETVDLVTNFYTYEGVVKAINKVSLRIDHGSTFGLVGESGCGKSVIARSMLRIVPEPGRIESGKILLYPENGNDQEAVDLLRQSETYMEDLRGNMISMIFQEPGAALNPIMTIGEQIAESYFFHRKREMYESILARLNSAGSSSINPLIQYLKSVINVAIQNPDTVILKILGRIPALNYWKSLLHEEAVQRTVYLLEQLGISNPEDVVNQYPHNLSGGMKQRIVIAIALACNPALLIADEATSNLDVTIQAQILDLLNRLKKRAISSILLITHDLGVVAETCDRVGVMYAGNLCEVADVGELFENPLHPYTRALLDAVPKFEMKGDLQSIEGNVPNLVIPPPGCRFHPRCPHATDVCRKTFPQMKEIKKDHLVACFWAGNKAKSSRLKAESVS
jgi:peptide/nickel transport system ATP-binding protein